jgi:hypothetical protein
MHKTLLAAVVVAGLTAAPALAQSPPPATPAPAAAPATAATPAPAAAPAAKKKVSRSASRAAFHERQKKCAAEWKEAKAAGKIEKGMKWPKFWSACNKRLKAAG